MLVRSGSFMTRGVIFVGGHLPTRSLPNSLVQTCPSTGIAERTATIEEVDESEVRICIFSAHAVG